MPNDSHTNAGRLSPPARRGLMMMLILTCAVSRFVAVAAQGAPAATIPTTEVRFPVVFYAPSGPFPFTVGKAQVSAAEVAPILIGITEQINSKYPLYRACYYDPSQAASTGCDPTTAGLIVETQFFQDPASTPDSPAYVVMLRSLDMTGARELQRLTFNVANDAADARTALAALSGISLDGLTSLLGNLVVVNGHLSLVEGYQPYVQLVPTLVNSDDPSYAYLAKTLLERNGIPTVSSAFNAGTIASGATPLESICGQGQRYFVYSISNDIYPHPLSFSSKIETHASADLYDCTDMSVIALGVDQHRNVITTKSTFTSLIQLLSAAIISRSNSWSGVLQASGFASALVDSDPTLPTQSRSAADNALQAVVNNLCVRLAAKPVSSVAAPALSPMTVRVVSGGTPATSTAPTPTPEQQKAIKAAARKLANSPTPQNIRVMSNALNSAGASGASSGGGGTAARAEIAQSTLATATGASVTPSTTLVSLDVSGFVTYQPKPLRCSTPLPNYPVPQSTGTGRWAHVKDEPHS